MAKNENMALVPQGATLPIKFNPAADAGRGFEEAGKDAYAIPYLILLQALSPQCNSTESKYLKGAAAGIFVNSVSGKIYGPQVMVVQAHFQQRFVQWADREKGGGLRGVYQPGDPIIATAQRDDRGRLLLADGTYLSDTRYHFVMVVVPNVPPEPCVFGLTSTQIKKSRAWMTHLQSQRMVGPAGEFCPPTYASAYTLTSCPEQNAKGKWFGFKPEFARFLGDKDAALYSAAKTFAEAVQGGTAEITTDEEEN